MNTVVMEQRKRIHPHKFTLWMGIGSIVMMFAGLTSAYIVKRNQVNWAYAGVVAVGLLIGAYFGARLAGSLNDVVLKKAFGVFLLLISVKLLLS